MTADTLVSVVLPAYKQVDHITSVVREFSAALGRMPLRHEIVLVPNGPNDGTTEVCAELSSTMPDVRSEPIEQGGWGRAVKHGIKQSRGDLLCYTNSARTAPQELALVLLYATAYPDVVVKANRKIREHWSRRIGSLLYNIECRTLFDLSNWDVNGTPKVFPRRFEQLMALTRDDDLIDAEFNLVCRRYGYPMVEVPIFSTRRHGGRSTTNMGSAFRMYLGALQLWRAHR